MPTAIRSPRVRLAVGVLTAVAVGSLASGGGVSAAPPAPREISGDDHSPAVAGLATGSGCVRRLPGAASTTRLIRYIGRSQRHRRRRGRGVRARRRVTVRAGVGRAPGTEHQVAVLAALAQLGVSYVSNSSEPGVAFDCSGLTAYAWGRAGVALYRQSGVQISDAAPRDSRQRRRRRPRPVPRPRDDVPRRRRRHRPRRQPGDATSSSRRSGDRSVRAGAIPTG